MLKGVEPSVVLPAHVLLRSVMICPPPFVPTPMALPLMRHSEIRAVAAAPLFCTNSPTLALAMSWVR
jgi:hypothetical protein